MDNLGFSPYDHQRKIMPVDPEGVLKEGFHQTIQLSPGLYQVIRQQEYVYTGTATIKETRIVED